MYSLDRLGDIDEPEVALRAFLREAQRQVCPVEVSRRRRALRQALAECVTAEPPMEPRAPYLQPGVRVG